MDFYEILYKCKNFLCEVDGGVMLDDEYGTVLPYSSIEFININGDWYIAE